MQSTAPFTFKKPSFAEEAEANLSSYSNPYNWQVNLANSSDGVSFAQVRVFMFLSSHFVSNASAFSKFRDRFIAGVSKLLRPYGPKTLTGRSNQKARAAELNAARARRAAQMQSVDDEIPDLSGPVSLGMYKFTRRGRGRKYETHKLSELQKEEQEKEAENKVTESAVISSAHSPLNIPPPTPLSSSQITQRSAQQVKDELNNKILNWQDKPSPDSPGSHDPIPLQYDKIHPSHTAAKLSSPIRPIYTDIPSFQASGQAGSFFPTVHDHSLGQDSSAFINNPDPLLSQIPGQGLPSFSPIYLASRQHSGATFNPALRNSHPAIGYTVNSIPHQDHNSSQIFNVSINTNRPSPQGSRQAQSSYPLPNRQPNTSQPYSQLATSLKGLIKFDRRGSNSPAQADLPFLPQNFQHHTFEPYREIENKVNELLTTNKQGPQGSPQVDHPASPKAYSPTKSLPLSDTLPTASFNLETNQWDPDLPEADMPAHTPTNKSTRGGHSGQQSSRQSSSRMSQPSQDARNPHAIVTTTRAGRPYTNPYMPIHPPPSTARPMASSEHVNPNTQYNDPTAAERERNMRYVDQEEARYRALEQTLSGHAEDSLDDPFQDQTTHTQQYGRNQPSDYAEHAVQEAAYGQWPDDGHRPQYTTHASGPSASSFFSEAQQPSHIPSTGMTPYRSQRSAYEQQPNVQPRAQQSDWRIHEQRSADPRASVRLPAVRGTMDQQKVLSQEPRFEGLSLEDSTGRTTENLRHPRIQGSVQPASGRVSHAVPIRDPAAYTGSGLTTRRNQEALRQNLDTVVASSQGPTGSARTVMNDPHRDRQPARRPSSTVTDSTVTGSTLRAEAPSYDFGTAQRPVTTNPAFMNPRPGTIGNQGRTGLEEGGSSYLQASASNKLERAIAHADLRELSFRAPAIPPGFSHDAVAYTQNAGLPPAAIGAGNTYMTEIAKMAPKKKGSEQRAEDIKERLESAATWFRHDSRDLSHAAEILSRETLHRMNAEQFPLEDAARRTVGQLADDSQDDDPSDRARQASNPRPIGHGRPAGFNTPPSIHGARQATSQAPFSTIAGVSSVDDEEGMARSGRKFLEEDAKAAEAMFAGVYSNLMTAKNGPYDYTNHYGPPPAYAIDRNARNNNTYLDPEWFATAPPARVGRDPRREQGEYEDPTQGSAGRRGDHVRVEVGRRESGGRGGNGGRAWGRV